MNQASFQVSRCGAPGAGKCVLVLFRDPVIGSPGFNSQIPFYCPAGWPDPRSTGSGALSAFQNTLPVSADDVERLKVRRRGHGNAIPPTPLKDSEGGSPHGIDFLEPTSRPRNHPPPRVRGEETTSALRRRLGGCTCTHRFKRWILDDAGPGALLQFFALPRTLGLRASWRSSDARGLRACPPTSKA